MANELLVHETIDEKDIQLLLKGKKLPKKRNWLVNISDFNSWLISKEKKSPLYKWKILRESDKFVF